MSAVVGMAFGLQSRLLLQRLSVLHTANFKSFIDPGNADCYPSHPTQTIVDLAPGAADNWWLGPDGTTTRDAGFGGTAGAQTAEHWIISPTNQEVRAKSAIPIYRDFVKTGAVNSLAAMVRFTSSGTDIFLGTRDSVIDSQGFNISCGSGPVLSFAAPSVGPSTSIALNTWVFVGVSWNQPGGTNASFINVDGSVTSFTAGANDTAPTVPGRGYITKGSGQNHLGPLAAWNVALSQGEMEYVRAQMTRRYA